MKPFELGLLRQFGYWVAVNIAAEYDLIYTGIILKISVSDDNTGYVSASCEFDHVRRFDIDNAF